MDKSFIKHCDEIQTNFRELDEYNEPPNHLICDIYTHYERYKCKHHIIKLKHMSFSILYEYELPGMLPL